MAVGLFALASVLLAAASATGIDEKGMAPQAVPGDAFYTYANGTWLAKTEIPADKSRWGTGSELTEKNNRRMLELVATAVAKPTTDAERMVADYYTAYMDDASIEAKGIKPLAPTLATIAALADKTALARYLGTTLRADVDALNSTDLYTENVFGLWVVQGLEDGAHYTPYLMQGGLGMPDRAYYLTASPKMDETRAKYLAHVERVFALGGFSEPAERAKRVVALEHKIAESHVSRADSEDVLKANNPWRGADFGTKAPGMDWAEFFRGAGLKPGETFIVWQPSAFVGESALVASAPLADWKDYLAFHALNQYSGLLPKAFVDERFAFYGTVLAGTPQPEPRNKRALASADANIGDLVGQVYVAKYFPPQSKAKVQEMVTNLIAAFDQRIERLDWMAPATKEQARAKLKTLYVGIGYPDRWKDYRGLKLDRGDALGNVLRAEAFTYRKAVAKIGGPVDRTEWCMVPQVVNAVNMPLQNALDFPAGILQPPYFDPSAPDAANYGSIGAIIGHEISHSFDDQGAQFDAQGRLRDWWTPDDLAHFKKSSTALAEQYSTYRPFPDLAVNGQQTLSENIADLAGLTAAYDAYHAASGPRGPAATGSRYTPDQLFFISFAQSWRNKTREPALRQQILTDGHAPAEYRALTVRNIDAWYRAFEVKSGEKLYLDPGERVRVW
jgi:putative endopeptidase